MHPAMFWGRPSSDGASGAPGRGSRSASFPIWNKETMWYSVSTASGGTWASERLKWTGFAGITSLSSTPEEISCTFRWNKSRRWKIHRPGGAVSGSFKMGGVQWEKIRSRAKASIQELAERLIAIYAKREITPGIAFDRDTREQREFEESFPYVETPDQLSAIEAIKRAMEKPEPMDMLLCGDVGFGKRKSLCGPYSSAS